MTTISHAALSDPGRTHDENQDRWLADPARGLYLVSDGMAEPISPQTVVDTLPGLLQTGLADVDDLTSARAVSAVRSAVAEVSRKVHAESERNFDVLGATVVLALVRAGRALVAHLGDSRAYLLRAGKLERLTRDHSYLERMIELGWIKPEEASWRGNGGPTRYAGMKGVATADVRLLDLQPRDRLLLCSDGLTEMLDDDEIREVLVPPLSPGQACARLVAAANRAGGDDNITVVVVAMA
jgi:serine/threonine protein phosphatase PrpC